MHAKEVELGHECFEKGDYPGSIRHYKSAIKSDNHIPAWFYLGRALSKLRRFDEACDTFMKAMINGMRTTELLLEYASALVMIKRYEEALTICDENIDLNPDNALAHCNRGSTLIQLEKYEMAIEAYNTALKYDPCLTKALAGRGDCYKELNNTEQSITNYLFIEKYDTNKKIEIYWDQFDKNDVLTAIKSLPVETQLQLLTDCKNPKTQLGAYFYQQRGFFSCTPNSGTLYKVNQHFDATLKNLKDSMEIWFKCVCRLIQAQVLPKELCAFVTLFYCQALGFDDYEHYSQTLSNHIHYRP